MKFITCLEINCSVGVEELFFDSIQSASEFCKLHPDLDFNPECNEFPLYGIDDLNDVVYGSSSFESSRD